MNYPPVVSYGATSPLFNDKEKYPYFVRTVADDMAQTKAITDIITHYSWTHVMCMYSEGKNSHQQPLLNSKEY